MCLTMFVYVCSRSWISSKGLNSCFVVVCFEMSSWRFVWCVVCYSVVLLCFIARLPTWVSTPCTRSRVIFLICCVMLLVYFMLCDMTWCDILNMFSDIPWYDLVSSIRWYHWDPTKWCINIWYYIGLAYALRMTRVDVVLRSCHQVAKEMWKPWKYLKNNVKGGLLC